MKVTRRGFLTAVGAAVAVPWDMPRTVAAPVASVPLEELNAVRLRAIQPALSDNFFRATPLLAYLRDTDAAGAAGMH